MTGNPRRPSVQLFAFLALPLMMAGCGGGPPTITTGCGANCPQAKAEFLYAVDLASSGKVPSIGSLNIFTVNSSTGVPGPPTGVLGPPTHASAQGGFVEATPSGKFLYSSGSGDGFAIDPNSGVLTAIAGSPFPLRGGRIAIDAAGRFLYTSYVGNPGSVAGFTINNSTGALTAIPGSPFTGGNGGNAGLAIDPGVKFLYVGNAGGGISVFGIDSTNGALTPVSGSPFSTLLPGSPDEIRVHPSGKFLYATLNGNDESVEASFAVAADGSLSPTTNSSWGPNGTFAWSAALDPQGKFLFTANINDGTISAFTVDQTTGSLAVVPGPPISGGLPWDLVVDPSGKFLYITDLSLGIVTFRITSTGALTLVNQSVPVQPQTVPLWLALVQVH